MEAHPARDPKSVSPRLSRLRGVLNLDVEQLFIRFKPWLVATLETLAQLRRPRTLTLHAAAAAIVRGFQKYFK